MKTRLGGLYLGLNWKFEDNFVISKMLGSFVILKSLRIIS